MSKALRIVTGGFGHSLADMTQKSNISDEQIREIIGRSGYLEEQKVPVAFEKQGFFAAGNYAFEDQDEHKSREIDFIATKYRDFVFGVSGFYFSVLGEVKTRTNPLVFFERKKYQQEFREAFVPIVATQEFFPSVDPCTSLKRLLRFSETHHQVTHPYVSSQFCEIDGSKAVHKDLYEKLIVPLLKCVDSETRSLGEHIPPFDDRRRSYFLYLLQPTIVVSGPLYAFDLHSNRPVPRDYVLYRRHYASKTVKRSLLIDVVTSNYLPCYITDKLLDTYSKIGDRFQQELPRILQYCIRERSVQRREVSRLLRKIVPPLK